jgi:hypothetical protein
VANSIQELIQPQIVDPDATMVEVFGEKSQAADNSLERILGDVYSLSKEGLPRAASVISSMISGSGEVYDEEGNVIAHGGSAPDLAFAPFMSKKNLASLLYDLKGGSKTKLKQLSNFLGRYASTPQDAAVNIGAKLSKELTPPIASSSKAGSVLKDKGEGLETVFGKLLADRSKKKLYKKLATKKEFEKFKGTFPEATSGTKLFPAHRYQGYKDWLKNFIYSDQPIIHKLGRSFPYDDTGKRALGAYQPDTRDIRMASELTPSQWGSTLRHEIKHKLDDLITDRYRSGDYYKLKKIFKDKMKPEPKKQLEAWEQIRTAAKHFTGRDVAGPTDVERIKYLLDPTETLARSTQLKTKGIGQTISETLGVPSKPRRELEEIYTKEFIKELMNKYWAAAPVGALGTEMKLRDNQ